MKICVATLQLSRRQLMIIKTFIIGMVLVGIAVILTELHRYMVYSEELEREEEID